MNTIFFALIALAIFVGSRLNLRRTRPVYIPIETRRRKR